MRRAPAQQVSFTVDHGFYNMLCIGGTNLGSVIFCLSEASNSQIVSVPRSQAIASEVNKLNSAIISVTNTSFSPTDFLGSMPLNISRRNLILLQRDEYFVTEKSDGVRYLLYVVASSSSSGGERT